ncbi:hypothetical protein [Kitasatospora griseola]|uniref:hypothetical protein n=1 Tax=Kitasatospora griseola TaxID=2064 RepID=UPI001670BA16|nr:hypothetical protein [Kitasatospora griseola]GGR00992.1 hypothetical protein GCM10010195_66060 [Kitasatospora griseola]
MSEPWTIERISESLGAPAVRHRFLAEINRAPAHELLAVFAHWQGIADSLQASAQRGQDLLEQSGPDGELPGEWIDVTEKVRTEATGRRNHAA